ncbi:7392_t:CDS:2 [Cetraspora pellucida]|uniref:7392_t:CDS:1 n=1 Tax=Cetraspora pellucida TaxID=1433469 RepID=A0ACA9NVA9_9GLOM|nr:7392_t:CDS:2 [Cetraspora pellucida]
MGLKFGPLRKKFGIQLQRKHNRVKCPSYGCNLYFLNYEEVSRHVKDTLLEAKYEQESKIEQKINDKSYTSFKEAFCNQLDDIINGLTKYYHLAEQRSLIDEDLKKSYSSLILLKQDFSSFSEHQFKISENALNKKIKAEREKFIVKCKEEISRLKCELTKNKDQIASLVNQNRELYEKYFKLQEKYTTLHQEYQALIENNNDYFIERCELLKKENYSLIQRNLELYEEIEDLKERNKEIERVVEVFVIAE